jgi:fluoride exporter
MLFTVIFAGGAFGALSRYLVSMAVATRLGARYPWATLAVNLLGCLGLGLTLQLLRSGDVSPLLRSFVTVGILGSFTTFSTFSVEAVALFEGGRPWSAMSYITLSCLAGLAAFAGGIVIGLSLV